MVMTDTPRRTGSNMGTPELAELIVGARDRLGMSQNELARQTGKSRGFMWQIENGHMSITSEDTAEVFAEKLLIDTDAIFAAGKVVEDSLYDLVANASPEQRRAIREMLTGANASGRG